MTYLPFLIIALVFGLGIGLFSGSAKACEYFTAYITELSLSLDNLFCFLAIFSYFGIKEVDRYRILNWGIIGAFALRAVCIFSGSILLHSFHWLYYVFGLVMIWTAYKTLTTESEQEEFSKTGFARFIQTVLPFDFERPSGGDVSRGGVFRFPSGKFSTLFFVLLIIEFTDLIFATDSIPAALGCSADPFIVYSSNIMAVLGLRTLFFALSDYIDKAKYLKYGISFVLALIGLKMMTADIFQAPTILWLLTVAGVLCFSVFLSNSSTQTES